MRLQRRWPADGPHSPIIENGARLNKVGECAQVVEHLASLSARQDHALAADGRPGAATYRTWNVKQSVKFDVRIPARATTAPP
jgi:hypothetical protein